MAYTTRNAKATQSARHSKWHTPLEVAYATRSGIRHSKWHTPLEVAWSGMKWHEVAWSGKIKIHHICSFSGLSALFKINFHWLCSCWFYVCKTSCGGVVLECTWYMFAWYCKAEWGGPMYRDWYVEDPWRACMVLWTCYELCWCSHTHCMLIAHSVRTRKHTHISSHPHYILITYSPNAHYILIAYSLHTHYILIAQSLDTDYILIIFITYSTHTHCIPITFWLRTHCLIIVCSLPHHCLLIAQSLHTRCLIIEDSLHSHCLIIAYSLDTYSLPSHI